tara:strand:- start:319 stop:990 length:672 start_codon:yes stop_codon:yes gene_type:complete
LKNRRQQLVDRFEELTKQEIKNYNDSLLETHKSLEEFRRGIQTLAEQNAGQIAILFNQKKKIEAENIDLKAEIQKVQKKIDSVSNEFMRMEKEKCAFEARVNFNYKSIQAEQDRDIAKLDDVKQLYIDLTQRIEHLVSIVAIEDKHCLNHAEFLVKALRNEILSLPCKATQIKKELLKDLASNKVDVDGVNQNITNLRKEFNYEKKKMEHVLSILENNERGKK